MAGIIQGAINASLGTVAGAALGAKKLATDIKATEIKGIESQLKLKNLDIAGVQADANLAAAQKNMDQYDITGKVGRNKATGRFVPAYDIQQATRALQVKQMQQQAIGLQRQLLMKQMGGK